MVAKMTAENEQYVARAVQRFLRRAPRKVRLVADLVRDMNVEHALGQLKYMPQAAADEVAKVVKSAAANLRDRNEDEAIEDEELYIREIYVDEGVTLKRMQPAAMGRAQPINKKTSHVTVVVARQSQEDQDEA